jgi:hypothetical protein
MVLEARSHLLDAALWYEQAGFDRAAAQRAAIRDFGPAWQIGLAARGIDPAPLVSVARAVALSRRGFGHAARSLPRLRRHPRPPVL